MNCHSTVENHGFRRIVSDEDLRRLRQRGGVGKHTKKLGIEKYQENSAVEGQETHKQEQEGKCVDASISGKSSDCSAFWSSS
ncbi:hypothetical protein, partial [Alkalibacillus haloalkaliphilus]|uniref:hypothetical protein n=1 Tax=Alkalibacillus haloalkaliphilus TaxID=94136 RepID=UPI0029357CB0